MDEEDIALVKQLTEALESAEQHLDYCGYGDQWERECAKASKLEQKIENAIAAGNERLSRPKLKLKL